MAPCFREGQGGLRRKVLGQSKQPGWWLNMAYLHDLHAWCADRRLKTRIPGVWDAITWRQCESVEGRMSKKLLQKKCGHFLFIRSSALYLVWSQALLYGAASGRLACLLFIGASASCSGMAERRCLIFPAAGSVGATGAIECFSGCRCICEASCMPSPSCMCCVLRGRVRICGVQYC